VNNQPLAEAIARLRGEWAERTGGTFAATAIAWQDLASAELPGADVIIFPSRYLGELCERKALRPIRENVLQNSALNYQDVFPLIRERLLTYDKQVMALPLGIALPVMGYRHSMSQVAKKDWPPATWDSYEESIAPLRRLWADSEDSVRELPFCWEPFDDWTAELFLARIAPYAVGPDHQDTFFDPANMQSRIADAPFVRALSEFRTTVATAGIIRWTDKKDGAVTDAKDAAQLLWSDAAMLVIGLSPSRQRPNAAIVGISALAMNRPADRGWALLPGSTEVYDYAARDWKTTSRVNRVPLLGIDDLLSGVTTTSRNAASAFQLLEWLASASVSSQFASAADGAMPVRNSLASAPDWYDPRLGVNERKDLGDALQASLNAEQCLIVPCIPGVDEYLAALDQAVKNAVEGGIEPEVALKNAALKWEEITDTRGREAQRRAYLRHLGLESK